ncbi:MAG TPA: hypothetical protein VFG10_16275 [Saprospiraceae bacterium]|nr:hypothetical protein [Saprospiraceae bacterium]
MKSHFSLLILLASFNIATSQEAPLQNYRQNSKAGLNIFETPKNEYEYFDGLKVRIGGNFTQDYQGFNHENSAAVVLVDSVNINKLIPIKDGFNRAMANLNVDAQLADGIRIAITMYLSSRSHPEAWVKGGYIQFDKLSFLNSDGIDSLMRNVTIKIGDYEVDYGDQHYRRTDGGNAIYNPFVENYIMDEFTTEIGGDIIFHPKSGVIVSLGITNGQLDPTVVAPTKIDSATGKVNKYLAAFHGKLGYDKQINPDVRLRLTGSFYMDKSAEDNTLFFGDRAGSHYFQVLENPIMGQFVKSSSGRFDPDFTQEVSTFMINPFIKYRGIELFGTYEIAKGRKINEVDKRDATQLAVDLILRFPKTEKFWIGGRYNAVTSDLPLVPQEVTINRVAGSLGWFITDNIMAKAEYVSQVYNDFPVTDIRSGGKFSGFMIEASVGF